MSSTGASSETHSPDISTHRGNSSTTIYDVAKAAGVNPSTVSRALNKPGRVSAKTQRLVAETAKRLNYRANHFAQALPTGRTRTLGLIVADITNPTFFDIVRGAQTTGTLLDYTLVLAESTESAANELTVARRMMNTTDGLILASPRMDDNDIRVLAIDKPIVVINRDVEGIPCVTPDMRRGIGEAVRSLASAGHRKLVFAAGPAQSWMSARRWELVKAACDWSRVEAVCLEPNTPTVDGGRNAAGDVLSTGATAVLAYNDLLAIGIMQQLQAGGINVPDHISVVGFDDIFGSDFTTPPLTSVRSPLAECGARATRLLLDYVQSGTGSSQSLSMETELVLRGSTGRAASER